MVDGPEAGPPAPPPAGPDDGGTGGDTDRRPSRRSLTLLAVPLVALVVITNVGDAMAPTLVDTHPAVLIAMNARNRNLVLVTNSLDAWTYYVVGTVRLLISDPLFFILGAWYGDAAVRWMERRTRTWGQILRRFEEWFGKAAYPLIFVAPNTYICLFAGAAGMPVGAFFAVNLAGTIARLYLIRQFGEAFEAPIQDVVDWIGAHRVPLLAVTVGLVLLSLALEARRGGTEVTSLAHLDEELEAERARGAGGVGQADGTGEGAPAGRDEASANGEAPAGRE
ncbi:MAG TPA: VTT domain-containing protein, partial [Acidimicrobiales bacterium]